VAVAYYEIYSGRCSDLLHGRNPVWQLGVWGGGKGGIVALGWVGKAGSYKGLG
jgi:hypothetical protein